VIGLSLAAPVDCLALSSLGSLGLDQTMKAADPSILQTAGLKDLKAGDTVGITKNTRGPGFIVTNTRTGKSIVYPPPKSTGIPARRPPAK
jgi:hypothetical protein